MQEASCSFRRGAACVNIAFSPSPAGGFDRLITRLPDADRDDEGLAEDAPRAGAQLEAVSIPRIGPNEVLVRVRAASICGTDLHIYAWDPWSASRVKPPLTFGHEFCGTVERVGEEVTGVAPGDFVSAEMHVNCGRCHQCRVGQPHVCQNLKIIGID